MSYQSVVNLIRDTANEVNPNGLFTHGRRSDFSLEFSEVFPQIHLEPFRGNIDKTNSQFETYTINLWFLQQDSPESSNEKREEIIAEMDELCHDFINAIFTADNFTSTGFETVPNYRILSGVTSGYLLTFKLSTYTSPC